MTEPKLNILSLPSHTFILFALIALVVLGAAFASLLPGSQLCWPPIVLGLTLLPLRDFLRRPDRELARWKMAHHDDEATATIEAELASLGINTGTAAVLRRLPTVVISERPADPHAFGSFRRAYLGIGRSAADRLSAALQEPRDATGQEVRQRREGHCAILAHELAHFLNRDVWLMWLSYSLLKMMVLVMLLNLWVGVNQSAFLIQVGPEVMRPEFWTALSEHMLPGVPGFDLRPIYEAMYQENPYVVELLADPSQGLEAWQPFLLNLVGAHWPFAAAGLALFVVHWRQLLRARELYADARTASLMGEADIVLKALTLYGPLLRLIPHDPKTHPERQPSRPLEQVRSWFRQLAQLPQHLPILSKLLRRHPTSEKRRICLQDPVQALGPWWGIALSVGLAVALLDFLLRGTLTAAYIYQPGPHVPFLVAFLVFAVWLTPRVCAGNNQRRDLARQIVLLASLFTAIKLLPHLLDAVAGLFLLLTGGPEAFGTMMDLWVYSMVGGHGTDLPAIVGQEVTWFQVIEWHVLRPIAYFALLLPPTLIGFLLADIALKRRALTWYRLEEKVQRVFWGISSLLALALALGILPIYNRLFFPYIYESWSVGTLVGMTLAFLALLCGGALFWHYDHKLARQCPHCDTLIPGHYFLGRRCECEEKDPEEWVLHPWLIARY